MTNCVQFGQHANLFIFLNFCIKTNTKRNQKFYFLIFDYFRTRKGTNCVVCLPTFDYFPHQSFDMTQYLFVIQKDLSWDSSREGRVWNNYKLEVTYYELEFVVILQVLVLFTSDQIYLDFYIVKSNLSFLSNNMDISNHYQLNYPTSPTLKLVKIQ